MADANTCPLDDVHPPKEESINVFKELLPDIRKKIVGLRKMYTSMFPIYSMNSESVANPGPEHDIVQGAIAAEDYDDTKLAHSVKEDSLVEVRVGKTAYGVHIFGKVKVLDGNKYILVRMFSGEEDGKKLRRLHSIFTGFEGGDRNLFWNDDVPIEFFNE